MKELPAKYRFDGDLNEQRSFNHAECGDTRSRLYVRRVVGGWLYHCHNCGAAFSGFQREGKLSPKDTIEKIKILKRRSIINKINKNKIYNNVSLPFDFTNEIPFKGVCWLDKYGISIRERVDYNLGYSKTLDRLILPVYNKDRQVIFWQGRNLGIIDKRNPKYKSCRVRGKLVFMDTGIITNKNETKQVTLVEDILSAIKVGRHIRAYALLGSYISDDLIKHLNQYQKIYIWLDADKYREAIKYAERMRQVLGKQVIVLSTKEDPKELNDDRLKRVLIPC